MRISLAQINAHRGTNSENFKIIEECVKNVAEKSDVILLPELWNYDFSKEYKDLNQFNHKELEGFLSEISRDNKINLVAGSCAYFKEGKLTNTALVYDREGKKLARYDKVHLYNMQGNSEGFTAGDEVVNFFLEGYRCGVIICYDLSFCEWVKMYGLRDTHLLFIPSAWPENHSNYWNTLLKARAMENQMYIAAVGSVGRSPHTHFGGQSQLINSRGEHIIEPFKGEKIKTAQIHLEDLKIEREGVETFSDRRPEIYDLKYTTKKSID
ncbi:MAG: nitrilase-related carbon-nitrogen hydrolase [Peptoniphilus sp.]|nr:nitrilase-related carbon-nitrogen hydrolase [Peptoniphilus sp.]